MKKRLITLLTKGHTLDRVKDRTGAYNLRNVNKFPKFGPFARAAAVTPPPAGHAATPAQPSLFEAAKAPAAEVEKKVEGVKEVRPQSSLVGRAVLCPPPDGGAMLSARPMPDGGQRTARPAFAGLLARVKAFLSAVAGFVPKTAARLLGRLRPRTTETQPRAQAELALEKVTVLRNDLSDADVVVVAVQRKPEDSPVAQAAAPEPAGNPWKRHRETHVKCPSIFTNQS